MMGFKVVKICRLYDKKRGTRVLYVSLPKDVVEKLGWNYGDYVKIEIDKENKELRIKKVE